MSHELADGDKCPECGGVLELQPVENCSCHISPPCGACVDNRATCPGCGWDVPAPPPPTVTVKARPDTEWVWKPYKGEHDFGNGKRVFDCTYDGSSGSTMEWRGRYEGDVTRADIIAFFGDGTFGHRGPHLAHGRFTYVLITD